MKILFCHGLSGRKATALRDAFRTAREALTDVLVASASAASLVLLAPAWRRCRRDNRVLHGIKDDVVPLADSIDLERRSGLPPERLYVEVQADDSG